MSVIDASAHVAPASRAELEGYMEAPWSERPFPSYERHVYARENEYWDEVSGTGVPGSDPAVVAHDLFDRLGASEAVLVPLGRGLMPSTNLSAAILAGTNAWLADRFLSADRRLKGTLRVDPRDPETAVREIERWAGHPGFVAIGVPTQALQPYGHASYLPIWHAAARHGLVVLVHTESAAGTDFPPTSAGYQRLAAEYHATHSLNYIFHHASLFAEGTFRWVDDLRFVFADGGFDGLWPLLWRIDKDWRGNRGELPAATAPPHTILRDHVRFVAHRQEGPADPTAHQDWLAASESAGELLMFGSNYPHWDTWTAHEAAAGIPEPLRERILAGNARETFSATGRRAAVGPPA
jgi:predicted TIM-barrel fold metal-dependent hydrolase